MNRNCSGIVVVDNNQNCNFEQSLNTNNCFRPSYPLSDLSTSNQIDKPIVLVQWEDAKQFFDPWTCKPNAWPCDIGIVFSNSSFSSSKSTKALPKFECDVQKKGGFDTQCIPNENIID